MPLLAPPTDEAIGEAAGRLAAGWVVAFATETVYGLGADTFNVSAIERVYGLKGRPARNPLIAHVLDSAQARPLVAGWDDRAEALAEAFWPGPLTIVLPRSAAVPKRATAGWPTIAVRAPAHPVARRLLETFGGPVSAPSANRSGHVSPTTARHVADDFAGEADLLILDGGPCEIGLESTVVELGRAGHDPGPGQSARPRIPRILRPGAVSLDDLRRTLGEVELAATAAQGPSPGTSCRHYAPDTPLEVVAEAHLAGRLASLTDPAAVLCFDAGWDAGPHYPVLMPRSPEAYAARLYGALREADGLKPSRVIVESPPREGPLWTAIHDRLQRAAEAIDNNPP